MPHSKMNRKSANQSISFSAPAKVNLFLAVTGKRLDGFHELISLLAKIDLRDVVTLEKTDRLGEISCKCLGNEELSGDGNLAWKAVEFWREITGEKEGVRVTIQKRIPVMAGLGGGSSDAVATLRGLNSWRGNPLKQEELMKIASPTVKPSQGCDRIRTAPTQTRHYRNSLLDCNSNPFFLSSNLAPKLNGFPSEVAIPAQFFVSQTLA
jgi:hypothetical protein